MSEHYVQFNNQKWREITQEAAKKIEKKWGEINVISPFGFEATQNREHLKKILRKFYCYLALDAKQFQYQNEIVEDYKLALIKALQEKDAQFFEDIVIFVKNKKFEFLREQNYQCKTLDKLVDIQTRSTPDIMGEYTNYIIASIDGLLEFKGECTEFMTRVVNRSRTFQLYVMFEKIFAHLLPPLTPEENSLMCEIHNYINNSVQIFYSPELMNVEASAIEKAIYYEIMKPRVSMIIEAINQNQDKTTIEINDFHTYRPLKLTLDKPAYDYAKGFIAKTYEEFV